MSRVTGATVKLDNGRKVEAHASGNSIAILCPNCGKQPILLIAIKYQKGSDIHNPATCTTCRQSYYILSNLNANELKEVIIKES
jgi:hypothetical protein